jgi:hypothetical protein
MAEKFYKMPYWLKKYNQLNYSFLKHTSVQDAGG